MQLAPLTAYQTMCANQIIDCVQYLPPQMRLTPTNITSVGLWGGTATLGAIWLVQVISHAQQHAQTSKALQNILRCNFDVSSHMQQ